MGLCLICQKEEEPTTNLFIGALCVAKFMGLENKEAAIKKIKNPIAMQMAYKFFLGKHIDIKDVVIDNSYDDDYEPQKKKAKETGKPVITATQRRVLKRVEDSPPPKIVHPKGREASAPSGRRVLKRA